MLYLSAKSEKPRTGNGAGIWLAIVIALGLHSVFLIIPLTTQTPLDNDKRTQVDIQFTHFVPPPPQITEQLQPAESLPEINETHAEPPTPPVVPITELEETIALDAQPINQQENRSESLDTKQQEQITGRILAAPFIREESVTEQIFGKPINTQIADPQPDFHFPIRKDLIAMLDTPMPELPFAYTEGLIHFAYEPGVKGDMQRFWDVITPEFGWRTNNGTEFKCVWVLIIAACGWK
jgi:hypothetical protein